MVLNPQVGTVRWIAELLLFQGEVIELPCIVPYASVCMYSEESIRNIKVKFPGHGEDYFLVQIQLLIISWYFSEYHDI